MTPTIDQERCTRCGLCAEECPPNAITQPEPGGAVTVHPENCMGCSHCGMVCPTGALSAEGVPFPPIPDEEDLVAYERTDRLLRTKRSVRRYRSAPLLPDDLEEILKTGSLTATASNSQQCRAHVLQGGEVAAAASLIAGSLLKVVRLLDNPLVRLATRGTAAGRYTAKDTLRAYKKGLQKTLEGKGDLLFFRAPAVVILSYPRRGERFGRTDCALAGAHMMLSAHGRNLGSCMIGFAEVALRRGSLRKKLGIPRDRRVGLVFTLGYGDRTYLRYPLRRSWELPFS